MFSDLLLLVFSDLLLLVFSDLLLLVFSDLLLLVFSDLLLLIYIIQLREIAELDFFSFIHMHNAINMYLIIIM